MTTTAPNTAMRYRLVRPILRAPGFAASRTQQTVIDHDAGRLRVLAGPGTGKTATLVEAIAERIERRKVDPATILVLTFSRRAAAELAQRLSVRIRSTTAQPLVRTMHSYAYALVREGALDAGRPAPRLLDAGQADLMVRDILAGHADDGGDRWPPFLRPALRVPGFAAELRDFLLRTASVGITPEEIARAGRRSGRPEWVAAARFITEYRDIGDLRQGTGRLGAALDQAELTTEALRLLGDPRVVDREQRRVRRLFVDEYQDVDPAQAELIARVAAAADEFVAVGDPDQSIYAFRGAQQGALEKLSVDRTVALGTCYRMPAELVTATRRICRDLPGSAAHRELVADDAAGDAASDDDAVAGDGAVAGDAVGAGDAGSDEVPAADSGGQRPRRPAGEVVLRVLRSAEQEAAFLADQLRRAHVYDEIPWERMAIILRSPRVAGGAIRRACAAVNVPTIAAGSGRLADDPVVAALLSVLRAGADRQFITGPVGAALLTSPLGGVDPMTLRRLRRALRAQATASGSAGASLQILGEMLRGDRPLADEISEDLAAPVRQIRDLIDIAGARPAGSTAESVLWQLWEATGLEARLVAASERGGRDGAAADAMLDAALELFARAADFSVQLPYGSVPTFVDLVEDENVPGASVTGRETGAVAVVSAHAAKGLEWDVVAIGHVQQDQWPDIRPRSSLLGLQELIDEIDGVGPLPARGRLADERRLFYVAATRARRQLIVTAVSDDDASPSRFLTDLADGAEIPHGWPVTDRGRRRGLHLPALVAELRRAVVVADASGGTSGGTEPGGRDDDSEAAERAGRAAKVLAYLAGEQVRGADPSEWHGVAALSSDAPLQAPGHDVVLSPSQVESLLGCPLRGVLERHGGREPAGAAQLTGIAVHAIAEGLANGASETEIDAAIDRFIAAQDDLAPWEADRLRRRLDAMRRALIDWIAQQEGRRRLVGSEIAFDVALPDEADPPGPAAAPTGPAVRLVGRVDWLSEDGDGRLVVTDFKTGSTVPSIAKAAEHAQLAVYQLAVTLGGLDRSAAAAEPGRAGSGLATTDSGPAAPGPERAATGPEPAAPGPEPAATGGAELVYLRRTGSATVRSQPPQTGDARQQWTERLRDVARDSTGPGLAVRINEQCDHCPVRSSCPLQPDGRRVTER